MKKVFAMAIVILFAVGTVAAYAGSSTCSAPSSSGKGVLQSMADSISSWSWGKKN
jgi:hypothetical protein